MLRVHMSPMGMLNPRALEWKQEPTVTTMSTALVQSDHCPQRDAPWEKIVETMLLSGQSCVYDPAHAGLRLAEGEWVMEVHRTVLEEMVAAGVLIVSTSAFGEAEYKPAPAISSWKATVDIHRGTRDALAHLKKIPRQRWAKLDMILMIAREGWKPCALTAGEIAVGPIHTSMRCSTR